MGEDYLKSLLKNAPLEDKTNLWHFLVEDETDFIESLSRTNAVTFEYPSWQVTVFSINELKQLIGILSDCLSRSGHSEESCSTPSDFQEKNIVHAT